MAEEEGLGGEQQTNGADNQPQAGIISQYVKDLSFENPNAPAVFQWQTQPKIEVDFNIGVGQLAVTYEDPAAIRHGGLSGQSEPGNATCNGGTRG